MISRIFSGSRCRVVRHLQDRSGAVDRFTQGTIRYGMQNLGRDLVLVDWDTGRTTMVFPDDIELLATDATRPSA